MDPDPAAFDGSETAATGWTAPLRMVTVSGSRLDPEDVAPTATQDPADQQLTAMR
jgi:hypothetical protein